MEKLTLTLLKTKDTKNKALVLQRRIACEVNPWGGFEH